MALSKRCVRVRWRRIEHSRFLRIVRTHLTLCFFAFPKENRFALFLEMLYGALFMQTLKSVLDGAAGEGIISGDQAGALLPYMQARGVVLRAPSAALGDIAGPGEAHVVAPVEDTEAPRFIRGFHDVLITIGVCIVMAGIWGVGSLFGVLPAVIVLAEILVRRQRPALPAVVLTLIFAHWIFMASIVMLEDRLAPDADPMLHFVLTMAPFALLMAPFYLRYRIPLALSLWIVSLVAIAAGLLFLGLSRASGQADFISVHPSLSAAIFFAGALVLFAVAMRYDLSDRFRVTRRSDVAFWLHLAAAPALLYAMLALVFLGDFNNGALFNAEKGLPDALIVVAIVAVFMTIGLVIDRRAFVTSGLVSLGLATASLLQKTAAAPETYVFATLLIVGLVVLTIGVGWPHFRRFAVTPLPLIFKEKLPPLR